MNKKRSIEELLLKDCSFVGNDTHIMLAKTIRRYMFPTLKHLSVENEHRGMAEWQLAEFLSILLFNPYPPGTIPDENDDTNAAGTFIEHLTIDMCWDYKAEVMPVIVRWLRLGKVEWRHKEEGVNNEDEPYFVAPSMGIGEPTRILCPSSKEGRKPRNLSFFVSAGGNPPGRYNYSSDNDDDEEFEYFSSDFMGARLYCESLEKLSFYCDQRMPLFNFDIFINGILPQRCAAWRGRLQKLDLSFCELSSNGRESATILSLRRLAGNPNQPEIMSAPLPTVKVDPRLFPSSSNLVELILANCCLTDVCLAALASQLLNMKSLKTLDLGGRQQFYVDSIEVSASACIFWKR